MIQQKINFSESLPDNEELLTLVKSEFPAAKCKISFNGYIDITEKDIASSLDISKGAKDITILSKFNEFNFKYVLLQIAVFMVAGYVTFFLFDFELGTIWTALILLIPVWTVRLLLSRSAMSRIKERHEQVVSWIADKYEGALVD